jgi:hypothetical protein
MTELNLCKRCGCYCKDEYCNECNELIELMNKGLKEGKVI